MSRHTDTCDVLRLQIVVLRTDTMDVMHYGIDAKAWVSDVKFSPDSNTFAIGTHDRNIYLYDARGGRFKLKAKCVKHNSYITHFDFSSDSSTIQANDGAYEMLFCEFTWWWLR